MTDRPSVCVIGHSVCLVGCCQAGLDVVSMHMHVGLYGCGILVIVRTCKVSVETRKHVINLLRRWNYCD